MLDKLSNQKKNNSEKSLKASNYRDIPAYACKLLTITVNTIVHQCFFVHHNAYCYLESCLFNLWTLCPPVHQAEQNKINSMRAPQPQLRASLL